MMKQGDFCYARDGWVSFGRAELIRVDDIRGAAVTPSHGMFALTVQLGDGARRALFEGSERECRRRLFDLGEALRGASSAAAQAWGAS